jgi:hypothetical protein
LIAVLGWVVILALYAVVYGLHNVKSAALILPIIPGLRWNISPDPRFRGWGKFFAITWFAAMIVVIVGSIVCATQAHAQGVEIPTWSLRYRATLIEAATASFGINAPTARLAAQIHQESNWKPNAASPYAQGLAQFTPPTARWLPAICPEIGAPDPWDAGWSIRAMACYDAWLYARVPHVDDCNAWAFTLVDYNGGQGLRMREQKVTAAAGDNPNLWWSNVELARARSPAAWNENRAYPRRILLVLEPAYLENDWGGKGACL